MNWTMIWRNGQSSQKEFAMKKALKATWKIISTILIVALLLLVILILTPIGYFTWRASQPISMPEYDGRTYYQLLAERRQAYADLATEYQASHPSVEVKPAMCFQTELAVSLASSLPWAGICAASEFVPALRFYGPKSQRMGCGQMGGTWMNFPTTWWRTYEKLLYDDILSTRPQSPVPYCRIPVP
jgi:hypothetical protein